MKEKILEIIGSVTNKSNQELEKDLANPNFCDSLQKVEIIISIEEEFNIFFDSDELSTISSIESIIGLVKRKI